MKHWLAIFLFSACAAQAQSPEEWIRLGETVHGGFGTLIPLGIRIGLDARERLKAAPRELDVTYYDGNGTPCACVVDGILLATAPAGTMGEALIRHRKTGETLRYRIPAEAYGEVLSWNKGRSARERYDIVMQAPRAKLFTVE